MREGLELYAFNPLFTKSQLHQFREGKGLRTSQSKDKLYKSFIDKIFVNYRLYFYAGYIYYPEREINSPIKGKHKPLITLEVVEKIMKKESAKPTQNRLPNLDDNLNIHPLKGMITCMVCGRKLGCYPSKGNGGVYYYYHCSNKYCPDRINVRKEVAEKEFEELIETMKLPKSLFRLYQSFLINERKNLKESEVKSIPQQQGQLLSIQEKMKKIEEKILAVSNEALIKKLEEERAVLSTLKEQIKINMNNQQNDEDNFEQLLAQSEPIFVKPVQMWRKSNFELRQLLSKVRFGGVLYYQKNQGYRTNETTGLYYLFATSKVLKTPVIADGGVAPNSEGFSKQDFDTLYKVLISQAQYIEAFHKMSEYYGVKY